MGNQHPTTSSQGSKDTVEEDQMGEAQRKTVFWTRQALYTHKTIICACTRPVQEQASQHSIISEWWTQETPPQGEKLSRADGY